MTADHRPDPFTDASAIVAGLGLPIGMFVANKSAAFMVVLAAILAVVGACRSGGAGAMRLCLASPWPKLALAGSAFIVWAFLSLLWSPVPRTTALGLGEAAVPALGALALGLAYAAAPPRRLGYLLAAGIALASLAAMADLATGMVFRRTFRIRPDTYVLNRAVVTGLLLTAPMFALLPAGRRWPGILSLALLAAAIVASESGAAKLGLLAGLLAGGAGLIVPRFVLSSLGLGTAGLILVAPWLGNVAARLAPAHVIAASESAHAGDRIAIWQSFGAAVQQKPLLGSGFNASTRMADLPLVADVAEPLRRMLGAGHPHNAFLQVWVELGVVGAILGVVVVLVAIQTIIRLPIIVRPLAIAFAAAALSIAAVSHGAWQAWWIATVGASVAMLNLAAREARYERI
ncbi:MAG: O-antigen ligase family protein [Proteobacteria bacterium]|nr:O-antigen ligase family protein [Pseudomonadota bacterium]